MPTGYPTRLAPPTGDLFPVTGNIKITNQKYLDANKFFDLTITQEFDQGQAGILRTGNNSFVALGSENLRLIAPDPPGLPASALSYLPEYR